MSTLDGIVFILDRPQDVVNVGAVVRVLGNFGLPYLRLIEPAAFDPERILTIARRGHDVLAATRRFDSLEEALQDVAFVLGTTSRERAQARPLLTPRQAAPVLLAVAAMGGVPVERTSPSATANASGIDYASSAPRALDPGTPTEIHVAEALQASSQTDRSGPAHQRDSDTDPAQQGGAHAGPRLAAVLFGPGELRPLQRRAGPLPRHPAHPHRAARRLAQPRPGRTAGGLRAVPGCQ